MRVFLFDIDGTILLAGGAGSRALNRLMRDRHQVENAMGVVRAGGKTDPAIIDEMYRHHLGRPAEDHEVESILTEYPPLLEEEMARANNVRVMPGAIEAVRYMHGREDVALGVATGNIEATARIKLSHVGVWSLFAYGGYGDDSPIRSELVATAVARARAFHDQPVVEDQFIVIGDTPADITAAHACGLRVIAVPTGSYDRDELLDHEPDWLLDTLEELPAWHAATG